MELIAELPKAPHLLVEHNHQLVLAFDDCLAVLTEGALDVVVRDKLERAAIGPDGSIYFSDDSRLMRVDLEDGEPRDITAPFGGHLMGRRQVTCMPDGAIWVEGGLRHQLLRGTYVANPGCPFADVHPVPHAADIYGNLWSLVGNESSRQVLVLAANAPDTWQYSGLPAGDWEHVIADSVGHVWVTGPSDVVHFCPRRSEDGWVAADNLPDSAVAVVGMSPDDLVMVCFANGNLLELDVDVGGRTLSRLLATVPGNGVCIHTDRRGAIWAATTEALYRRNPEQDAWQHSWEKKGGRLPGGGNHDIFATECGGRLFVAGGWPRDWGMPARRRVCDELFGYDPHSEHWEVVSHMYIPRRYNGISEMDGCVWVVGGETRIAERDAPEGQVLYLVDVYDPVNATWRAGPDLNVARTDPFVVACNGRIYTIGGAVHNSGPALDSVESIGPGESTWRMETPLSKPTRQGHGCALDGIVYCASDDGVFAYDTIARKWDAELPQPGKIGTGPLAAAYRGEVWVIGGFHDNRTRCYNPVTRTWRDGPNLPTEQSWGAAVVMEGQLFVIGGAHYSQRHEAVVFDDRTYVLRGDVDDGGFSH